MALTYPENTLNYKYEGKIEFTAFDEKLTDVSLTDLENFLKVTESTFFSNLGIRTQNNKRITEGARADIVATGPITGAEVIAAREARTLAQKDAIDAVYGNGFRPPARSDMKDRVKTKSETIALYLPPGLQFRDGVTYDNNFELGVIGAGALEGVRSGRSIASSVLKGIEESFSSFAASLSGPLGNDIAKVGAVRAASKFGGTGQGIAQTATGVTINPNRRSIMKGPNIRDFTFTFTLIPSSVSEAETIKKIITFFRTELYPEEIRSGNLGVGYKVPRKFDIRIKYAEKEIATRILPCFLQSVSTTYNPNSMSFHRGGEFAEIQMTLNFVEERALNKGDITGGAEFETKIEGFNTLDGRGLVAKYQGGY